MMSLAVLLGGLEIPHNLLLPAPSLVVPITLSDITTLLQNRNFTDVMLKLLSSG